MMSSGSRYHPYPSFTNEPRALSQRHNNQPMHQTSNGYGNNQVSYPQQNTNQWHGNYPPSNFQHDSRSYGPGRNFPWYPEFGFVPQMNRGWRPYPAISIPQPPAIQQSVERSYQLALECDRTESPMLSHLLTHADSFQSPIPSVSSSISSEVSAVPSVERETPVVQIDDPIAEAMAAFGLDPGLIHEIKEQARKSSICPTNLDNQSPNQNVSSVSVNQSLVSTASGMCCPVCNSSHRPNDLKKHLFNHMIRVIIGMERANKSLVLWIKENYPVVLTRTVYCQLCKSNFGDFTILDMRLHVEEIHWNKSNYKPNFEQIFDSCFPMWNQQELFLFGFCETQAPLEQCNPVPTKSVTPVETLCPVCSNMPRPPEQQSDIEQHAKHMRQHLQDLIAGKEQPNQKLTLWLKCHAPLSLERNIFCRICQAACCYLSEHARGHGTEEIDFCFPKWTPQELVRLGFTDETSVRSSKIPNQSSPIQSYRLTCQRTATCNRSEICSSSQSFELPRSNFDAVLDKSLESQTSDFNLLDNLQKFDIDDDVRLSTPSPGRLVIDIPDENYSPVLAIEEIVDDEGVDKTVDTNMHVDNYNSSGDETVDYDDDDDSCGVDKTVDTVARSYIGNDECSCGVDKIIGSVDTNMHVDNYNSSGDETVDYDDDDDSCGVDKTVDTVARSYIGNDECSCGVDKIIGSVDTNMHGDNNHDSCCVDNTVGAHIDNSAELLKNAGITQRSPIVSNSSSTGTNLMDDISAGGIDDSMDFSETLYPSSPGFVHIDSCPASPFESPTSSAPCTEQSGFITVKLSPASSHSAVNDSLYSDHELFNLVFPSEADKIEAAMAELTFRKKDYYGFFRQLAKFPTFRKQD